jgi:hypothetical protein
MLKPDTGFIDGTKVPWSTAAAGTTVCGLVMAVQTMIRGPDNSTPEGGEHILRSAFARVQCEEIGLGQFNRG